MPSRTALKSLAISLGVTVASAALGALSAWATNNPSVPFVLVAVIPVVVREASKYLDSLDPTRSLKS